VEDHLRLLVEEFDFKALSDFRDTHSTEEWNALYHDKEKLNSGTLGHWAIWYRHWAMLRLFLNRGGRADIPGAGVGWMNGRTLLLYAQHLDAKCRHKYYSHADKTRDILERYEIGLSGFFYFEYALNAVLPA
jgi:hypothetical protein